MDAPPPPHLSPSAEGEAWPPIPVGLRRYWPRFPSDAVEHGREPDADDLHEPTAAMWGIPTMLIVFFTSDGASSWLVAFVFEYSGASTEAIRGLALIIGIVGLIAAVWVTMRWVLHQPFRVFGRSTRVLPDILIGIGVGVLGLFIAIAVSRALAPYLPDPRSHGPLPDDFETLGGGLAVVAAVLLAPLGEELFFRGFVLGGLRRRMGPRQALVLSAAAFALAHLSIVRIVSVFATGLLFGAVYERRRNLLPTMVAHATLNALVTLIVLAGRSKTG